MGLRPSFQIKAGEEDVTAVCESSLVELTAVDASGMESDTLEFTLADPEGKIAIPRRGVVLSLSLGFEDAPLSAFGSYFVDEVEVTGPKSTITVRAKAADMRQSLKASRFQSYSKIRLGDIVQKIASRNALEARVDPALSKIEIGHSIQSNESDMHYLTRLAAKYGALMKVAGEKLIFTAKGNGKTVSGSPVPVKHLSPFDLTSYRACIAERERYGAVIARYVDAQSAKTKFVSVGNGEPQFVIPLRFADRESARAAAAAKFSELSRAKTSLELTLPGKPQLRAEVPIEIQGLRSGIDGTWMIERAEHRLDPRGYTVQLLCSQEGNA